MYFSQKMALATGHMDVLSAFLLLLMLSTTFIYKNVAHYLLGNVSIFLKGRRSSTTYRGAWSTLPIAICSTLTLQLLRTSTRPWRRLKVSSDINIIVASRETDSLQL